MYKKRGQATSRWFHLKNTCQIWIIFPKMKKTWFEITTFKATSQLVSPISSIHRYFVPSCFPPPRNEKRLALGTPRHLRSETQGRLLRRSIGHEPWLTARDWGKTKPPGKPCSVHGRDPKRNWGASWKTSWWFQPL